MRRLAVLLAVIPATALAQTAPPPSVPPTVPPPYGPALPATDPIEQPITEPLPMYSPMYQPTADPAPYTRTPRTSTTFRARRTGGTVEANLGPGWLVLTGNQDSETSEVGFGGALGVGGWATNDLAVTLRVVASTASQDGIGITNGFLGPSVQGWITDHAWLSGGAGLAILRLRNATFVGTVDDTDLGVGFDVRAGYNFINTGANTFNLSVEITPGFYNERGVALNVASVSLFAGYQFI